MSREDHAALSRLRLELAEDLGVAHVSGQEIVRALLHRALTDSAIRSAVTQDLASSRGQ